MEIPLNLEVKPQRAHPTRKNMDLKSGAAHPDLDNSYSVLRINRNIVFCVTVAGVGAESIMRDHVSGVLRYIDKEHSIIPVRSKFSLSGP